MSWWSWQQQPRPLVAPGGNGASAGVWQAWLPARPGGSSGERRPSPGGLTAQGARAARVTSHHLAAVPRSRGRGSRAHRGACPPVSLTATRTPRPKHRPHDPPPAAREKRREAGTSAGGGAWRVRARLPAGSAYGSHVCQPPRSCACQGGRQWSGGTV